MTSSIALLFLTLAAAVMCSPIDLGEVLIRGDKGRLVTLDLNRYFPQWCDRQSVTLGLPNCVVQLLSDPQHGDLFAGETADSPELRVSGNDPQTLVFTDLNRWSYMESTFDAGGGASDDSSSDFHNDDSESGYRNKFHSAARFDEFRVGVFSPRESVNATAEATIVIQLINHIPFALNTTVVVPMETVWSSSSSIAFPAWSLLRAFDADTSQENPDEIVEKEEIQISGSTIFFVSSRSDMSPLSVPMNATTDSGSLFIKVDSSRSGLVTADVNFKARDSEGALSQRGTSRMFLTPSTDSLLPNWRADSIIKRLHAFDTLVICHFTFDKNARNASNECNFRLAGTDLLSSTLSLTVPDDESVETFVHILFAITGAIDSESSFNLAVASPGTHALQNTMSPKALWDSTQGYYPLDVVTAEFHGPVASVAAGMSEMTAKSPPDTITTSFQLSVGQRASGSSEEDVKPSDYSLEAKLTIVSHLLERPQFQCVPDVYVRWVERYYSPPTRCWSSTEYDSVNENCGPTSSISVQNTTIIEPFAIQFLNADYRNMVWYKAFDVRYVVAQVHLDTSQERTGCFFLTTEFREVAPGDFVNSEEDLFWMPIGSVCRSATAQLTVRVVLGPEELCLIRVHRPPTVRNASATVAYVADRYKSSFTSTEVFEGFSPVSFELTSAARLLRNYRERTRSTKNTALALRYVENVASQTLMSGFTNIDATSPIAVLKKSVHVEEEPFGIPPSSKSGDGEILFGTERKLSALITFDSTLDQPHPRRTLTFADATGDGEFQLVRVSLRRDDNVLPTITVRDGCVGDEKSLTSLPEAKVPSVLSARLWMRTFEAHAEEASWIPSQILNKLYRRRQSHTYLIELSSYDHHSLSFSTVDDQGDDTVTLVMTRLPRYASIKLAKDSLRTESYKGFLSASGQSLPTQIRMPSRSCLPLSVFVDASSLAQLRALPPTSDNCFDDEMRFAMTDGIGLSEEVVIVVRIHLPGSGPSWSPSNGDNESTPFGTSTLFLFFVMIFVATIALNRRRVLRMIRQFHTGALHAPEDTEESDEEALRRQRVQERAEAVISSITGMVASRAATFQQAIVSQWESRRGRTRLVTTDDLDEEVEAREEEDTTHRRRVRIAEPTPSIAAEVLPDATTAGEEDDDWDDWETNGLQPHPQHQKGRVAMKPMVQVPSQQKPLPVDVSPPRQEVATRAASTTVPPPAKKMTQRKND